MARKTITLTIDAEGRDKGKTFVLTEMSADKGERWAIRALLALMNAGVDLPDGAMEAGFAGFAAAGIGALGRLDYAVAEPLLAEMWECVMIKPSPSASPRSLLEGDCGDIEEVKTRFQIRMAVMKLHVDFSDGGK